MEPEVVQQVAAGSTIIAFIVVFLLPISIWDSKTGQYYGYFQWKAAAVLLFTAMYFGFLSYRAGEETWETVGNVFLHLGMAVTGSRIYVEYVHHHMHKVWLHRRYHRLTGHAEASWKSAEVVDGAPHSRDAGIDGRAEKSE